MYFSIFKRGAIVQKMNNCIMNMKSGLYSFLLILPLLYTTHAFAFGGELHIKLTEDALLPHGFSPEVANRIGLANDHIDHKEALHAPTHVDSETFEEASALMKRRLREAAEHLIAGDLTKARDTFGYVTHTVQDFFSHSNYVEVMPGEPIDLLNLKNPSPDLKCSKQNKKEGLTTGYFPDSTTPPGKCSHGELNKDGGLIYLPHYQAANYAKKETSKMYKRFEEVVYALTNNQEIGKALLHKFKDGDHAADQYNTFKNETARAMVKVYPSPQKRGEEVKVDFSSAQYCEKFEVDIIDVLGRIVSEPLYKGPMEKDEFQTVTYNTMNLTPGMYMMRAEFKNCTGNGHGNQVFKFLIVQ
jgi:hypothetical protein